MKNKIEKIISIGASCDGMYLCNWLILRTKGPVDNMNGTLNNIYKLFNGDFLKLILDNNYNFFENIYEKKFDMCQFDGYQMIHNDFKLEKTKKELLNRILLFDEYFKKSKNNKNYFFIYSFAYEDTYFINDINIYINNLPDYIKKRLLILNGRLNDKDLNIIRNNNFIYPIFNYCTDYIRKPNNKEIVSNKFLQFWKENKHFYEELNNCKYEDINIIQNEES